MTFTELERKFDGVFDFMKLPDCHQVIRVLLRDNDRLDRVLSAENNKQMDFAEDVLNDGPKVKEKARSILKGREMQKRSPAEVVEFIKRMIENSKLVEKMTDVQLIDASFDAWSDEDMSSQKSAIIEELINRFRKCKNLKPKKRII